MGRKSRYLRSFAAVTTVSLLAATACSEGGSDDDDEVSLDELAVQPLEDRDAPATDLAALTDGQPAVVNFFASWCVPCIEEMPAFEAVHQEVGDEVAFIGLAWQDGDRAALEIVESTGVTYPTFEDVDGEAFAAFEGVNLPTTVFLNADGTVAEVSGRPLTESSLRDALDEHFPEV